jgi:lysophospholipase L1-like esterase
VGRSDILAAVGRLWAALGTGWLILGISLLMFLAIEGGYRALRAVLHPYREGAASGLTRSDHPYRDRPWFRDWVVRRDAVLHDSTRYDPYRGWRLGAVALPGLHVDTAGRRVTPQAASASGRGRQVFLLGASTMWGYTARDSATIPALVARELARRGVSDVTVVNLANSGYNVTQEAITLMLELRRGNVPDVAVALDGVNEAGAVLLGGAVGDVHDQVLAERRFARRSLLQDLIGHSALLERLLIITSGQRNPIEHGDSLCVRIADYYSRMVDQVEALSKAYGFTTYFLWQPTLARSRKPRTSWEGWLDGIQPEFQRLTATCGARTDSIMMPRRGATYVPLSAMFDEDTGSVFLDQWGHVTEQANAVIAGRIVDLLVPALEARRP